MKFLPIASLALVAPLLLGGCASSPSLEEEAQLLEYDKCLDYATTTLRDIEIPGAVARSSDKNFHMRFIEILQKCEIFRPLPRP